MNNRRGGLPVCLPRVLGDDVAVSLSDAGQGNWRVALYFHRAVDEATVRDLAAIAGGPQRPPRYASSASPRRIGSPKASSG